MENLSSNNKTAKPQAGNTITLYNIIAVFNPIDTATYAQATNTTSLSIRKLNTVITISNITESYGNSITLKATLKDENGNLINSGKAAFKLNGKILKDANGNVIYGYVKNGKAQITVKIPASMKSKTYNLTAVCNGKNYNRTEASTNVAIIAKP